MDTYSDTFLRIGCYNDGPQFKSVWTMNCSPAAVLPHPIYRNKKIDTEILQVFFLVEM